MLSKFVCLQALWNWAQMSEDQSEDDAAQLIMTHNPRPEHAIFFCKFAPKIKLKPFLVCGYKKNIYLKWKELKETA